MAAVDSERDPVNEVYDRACELVEAAAAIRRLADASDVALAAPAILGCLAAALDDLADASTALERVVDQAAASGGGRPGGARLEASRRHMTRGFANLEHGLRDARGLASAARPLTARVMERAGLTRSGLSVL